MGDENQPLTGFNWKSGSERDTSGIVIWPDVFLHTTETGEDLAIILMDSQGLFSSSSTPAEDSKIFGIQTLVSSIQLFNVNGVIQEDQLQYLQVSSKDFVVPRAGSEAFISKLVTEFAKYATNGSDAGPREPGKPYQSLIFLVRDWTHIDYEFGKSGGDAYINEILDVNESQRADLQSVRVHIRKSFEEISCFLLPSPGKVVSRGQNAKRVPYNGRWADMDEDFQSEMKAAIEDILDPKHLKVKKINGKDLVGSDFKTYLEGLFKAVFNNEATQITSLYDITVNENLKLLNKQLITDYEEKLVEMISSDPENVLSSIKTADPVLRESALQKFDNEKKLGSADTNEIFRGELIKSLKESYEKLEKVARNNDREIFRQKQLIELTNQSQQKRYKVNVDFKRNLTDQLAILDSRRKTMSREEFTRLTSNLQQQIQLIDGNIAKYEQELRSNQHLQEVVRNQHNPGSHRVTTQHTTIDRSNASFQDSKRNQNSPTRRTQSRVELPDRSLEKHGNRRKHPDMTQHKHGSTQQLILRNDPLEFNSKLLNTLNNPKLRNRKAVVVSIVGALRKGKSFFMDYCLRFMYANVSNPRGD
jgi:Guanylate-binding protein, N-terminal domain